MKSAGRLHHDSYSDTIPSIQTIGTLATNARRSLRRHGDLRLMFSAEEKKYLLRPVRLVQKNRRSLGRPGRRAARETQRCASQYRVRGLLYATAR